MGHEFDRRVVGLSVSGEESGERDSPLDFLMIRRFCQDCWAETKSTPSRS